MKPVFVFLVLLGCVSLILAQDFQFVVAPSSQSADEAQQIAESLLNDLLLQQDSSAQNSPLSQEDLEAIQQQQDIADAIVSDMLQQQQDASSSIFQALFKDFPFVLPDFLPPFLPFFQDQQQQDQKDLDQDQDQDQDDIQMILPATQVEEIPFFIPRTDIYETEKELRFEMELPGLVEDDLSVTVEDNILTVQGVCDPLSSSDDNSSQKKREPKSAHAMHHQRRTSDANVDANANAPTDAKRVRPLAMPQDVEEVLDQTPEWKNIEDDENEDGLPETGMGEFDSDDMQGMDMDMDMDMAMDMDMDMEDCMKEYIRIERPHGPFMRKFQLPIESLGEKVAARLDKGVLTISVPKHKKVLQQVNVTANKKKKRTH